MDETGVHTFVDKLSSFLKAEAGIADNSIRNYTIWCRRFLIHLMRNNGGDATYPLKILKFENMLPGANTLHGELPTAGEKYKFFATYTKVCYIAK